MSVELRVSETQKPRALGGQDTGQEIWGEVGTREGSSAACTGLAGDQRHMSCQHNLPSPQVSQDHAMKEPLCKQFDVALVNSATSIIVKHSTVWPTVEKAPLHYMLV